MSQHVVRNYLGIIYDKVAVNNRAHGFTKRALRLLNQADPGDQVFQQQVAQVATSNPDVAAMKQQVDSMSKIMDELRHMNE